MSSRMTVKICGISTPETMSAALDAGASMVGLVFHPKSPRYVKPSNAAALAEIARGRAKVVALVVDMANSELQTLLAEVSPEILQLHGTETPARVAEIEDRFGLECIKAVGVSDRSDIARAVTYHERGRTVLLDAKPPKDAAYPGGHGKAFDWSILRALPDDIPFLLSGGLTPENVGEAIGVIEAFREDKDPLDLAFLGVDVSSGVESAPGIKDPEKIRAFIANAQKAAP